MAVRLSGFSTLSGDRMKLFKQLVVGVEKMGLELKQISTKLGRIEGVLWEGTVNEADEIMDHVDLRCCTVVVQ